MMEGERWLDALPQSAIRLGLERIEGICAALGAPQGRFPAILVAGTNGKGSTCAFLSSVLGAAGLRVGLYTSPHLVSVRERIRIDGVPVDQAAFDEAIGRLRAAWAPARTPGDPDAPTYFEALTAAAFDLFARAQVDVAVLEVGLGGRLDATNVPGTDLRAAVVTRLGLDHADWLGGDIAAIAREKAAIARQGVPLITAPQPAAAMEALRAVAAERGAAVIEVGVDATLEPGTGGALFHGRSWEVDGIRLGLRGAHQAQNAAVALAALEACAASFPIGPEAAVEGLRRARWPGRLEVVGRAPEVVLDGAHNPDAVAALVDSFHALWPGLRPQIVFGVLADKEREAMMEALLPVAAAVHVCAPASDRAVPAEALAAEARGHAREVRAHASVAAALEAARAEAGAGGVVLVCGSLVLVGEARRLLCGDAPAI